MHVSRRGLITGFGALVAAPAIVRASSLMPVKAWGDNIDLIKCTERFLCGDYGTVLFDSAQEMFPAQVKRSRVGRSIASGKRTYNGVGAGERIYCGDIIAMKDGYAYRARPDDTHVLGVALTSSAPSPGAALPRLSSLLVKHYALVDR